jgi:hypothetical protein
MICPSCASNPEKSKACSGCERGLNSPDDQTIYLGFSASPSAMTWGSLPSQAIAMPAAIPAGTLFGRYRIESLLGEGGMGAGWPCWRCSIDAVGGSHALEREILKIEAEVGQRRDGLELRAFDRAVGLERERYIGVGE